MKCCIRKPDIPEKLLITPEIKLPLELHAQLFQQHHGFPLLCSLIIDVGRNDELSAGLAYAQQFLYSKLRLIEQMNDIPGDDFIKSAVAAFEMHQICIPKSGVIKFCALLCRLQEHSF